MHCIALGDISGGTLDVYLSSKRKRRDVIHGPRLTKWDPSTGASEILRAHARQM